MNRIKRLTRLRRNCQVEHIPYSIQKFNDLDLVNLSTQSHSIELYDPTYRKENMEAKKLKQNINDIINVNGGRISILSLSKWLCTDRSHVLEYTEEICAESEGKIHLLNDQEVVNNIYLNRIVREAQGMLQTKELARYKELLTRIDIPLEFILEVMLS
ncbi:E3 UFM1-protein ligase 1 [Thelohanellus kitauei]|uniref:E3 UFM1-protein ligase 1 n=1 Tax=Thelohanellus kitauei TaxID=669202 RepID=A0A0C2M8Y0_THEKT|nr:E3 UFM1-protein ligase 1 [Thelohanellus kitauei]